MIDAPTRPARILWVLSGAPAKSGAGLRTEGLIRGLGDAVPGDAVPGDAVPGDADAGAAPFEIVSVEPEVLFDPAEAATSALEPPPRESAGSSSGSHGLGSLARWAAPLERRLRPAWAKPPLPAERGRIEARLRRFVAHHDARAVVVSHATGFARLDGVRLPVPVIVDAYDLLWTQVRRRGAEPTPARSIRQRLGRARREALGRLREALARRYELGLLRQADAVWVCSALDRQRLEKAGLGRPVAVVPNFVAAPAAELPAEPLGDRAARLLFVGTMGYHANRSGVRWFAERIWPRLRAAHPDAVFRLVGGWPSWCQPEDLGDGVLDQPGIEVAGFVPSLDEEWREATVFVCPLHVGSGTRIKILEAWSRGVPVVSTSVGIEGLEARDGVEAAIADDPTAFVDRILALLDDPSARRDLARAGALHQRRTATIEAAVEAAAAALGRSVESLGRDSL